MSFAEVTMRGMRSPPDSPEFARRPPECEVRLQIDGATYSDSRVWVAFDGSPFLRTTQIGFHRFCQEVTGKPARMWPEIAHQHGDVVLTVPGPLSTVEQNLLKACFLTYLWDEPLFIPRPAKELSRALLDEFIIDNTGRIGTQPFIYYPPAPLQDEGEAAARLYGLRLLCRAAVKADAGQIDRIFTPLVVPGVLTARINDGTPAGQAAQKLWIDIREACDAALRKFTQRNR